MSRLFAQDQNTDLQVTLSAIRPDGQEQFVQEGFLRGSRRALDLKHSTQLVPVHTHLPQDVQPMPLDQPVLVRVGLPPFTYLFRAGMRIRVTITTPPNFTSQTLLGLPVPPSSHPWDLDTPGASEHNAIFHDREHPSRLLLAVLPMVKASEPLPACDAMVEEPCRAA